MLNLRKRVSARSRSVETHCSNMADNLNFTKSRNEGKIIRENVAAADQVVGINTYILQ